MIMENIDDLNDELDLLSDIEYMSINEAWQDVCIALEEYGIKVPTVEEFEGEMTFSLIFEDSSNLDKYTLYLTIDEEEGKFNIYATLATEEELGILAEVDENITDSL